MRRLTVVQLLPALESGGVERSTLEIADALVRAGHRADRGAEDGRSPEQRPYVDGCLGRRGVVEVTDLGVYNYRCINNDGTPPNCTIGLSEHSFGNAIDLASFKDANGETYVVNDDWVIDPNDMTCTAPTEPGKDAWLHEMICEIKGEKIWNSVRKPNYNALHRNHFHVDLTEDSDFITRRLPF